MRLRSTSESALYSLWSLDDSTSTGAGTTAAGSAAEDEDEDEDEGEGGPYLLSFVLPVDESEATAADGAAVLAECRIALPSCTAAGLSLSSKSCSARPPPRQQERKRKVLKSTWVTGYT
jgi:hypothetical protein